MYNNVGGYTCADVVTDGWKDRVGKKMGLSNKRKTFYLHELKRSKTNKLTLVPGWLALLWREYEWVCPITCMLMYVFKGFTALIYWLQQCKGLEGLVTWDFFMSMKDGSRLHLVPKKPPLNMIHSVTFWCCVKQLNVIDSATFPKTCIWNKASYLFI